MPDPETGTAELLGGQGEGERALSVDAIEGRA